MIRRVVPLDRLHGAAQWTGVSSSADHPVPGAAQCHGLHHRGPRCPAGRRPPGCTRLARGGRRSLTEVRTGGAVLASFRSGEDRTGAAAACGRGRNGSSPSCSGTSTTHHASYGSADACGAARASRSAASKAAASALPREDSPPPDSAGTARPSAALARPDASAVPPGGRGHILRNRGPVPPDLGVTSSPPFRGWGRGDRDRRRPFAAGRHGAACAPRSHGHDGTCFPRADDLWSRCSPGRKDAWCVGDGSLCCAWPRC